MTNNENTDHHHKHLHQIVLYDEDELEDAEKCGCEIRCCGICRSKRTVFKCLSCCTSPKFLLVFLCAASFLQGFIVNGLINVNISTLERRFHLQSQETGLVASSYDIGSLCVLLFVTYVGGRGHKALWLGHGIFIMGVGAVIFSLPHFIATKYDASGVDDDVCGDPLSPFCNDFGLRPYRGFFIVGQLLHGIGASPLYTLGVTYLDENVEQLYSATYHGLYYTFSIIGPGAGYLLGGTFLSFYTNLGETVDVSTTSQLWIGAWWIGFLAAGVITIVLALPVFLFPFQFPNTEQVRLHREREMFQDRMAEETRHDAAFGSKFKDFPKSFLILLRNPTLVCLSIAGAMESGIIAGISTFGPKYTSSIFSVSDNQAAFVFGGLALGSASVGMLTGSLVITKFKMKMKAILRQCVISAFISLLFLFAFLIYCPNRDFAGGTVPYNGEIGISTINSTCNSGCDCKLDFYNPVCGSDGISYYSSCFAGCTISVNEKNSTQKVLQNCSCIADSTNVDGLINATAVQGICGNKENSCPGWSYILFIVLIFFSITFTFFNSIPALQATIRSVPFNQRSFAVGVQWIFLRCLGAIPGPLIYGRVLDLTCVVWNEECGERGSCKRYDNWKMSRYIFALCISFKCMATLMFLLALCTYKPRKKGDEGSSESAPAPNGTSSNDLALSDQSLPGKGHKNPGFEDEDRTQL